MQPIYFPYTSLPGNVADALALFFSQVIVYQPSDLPIPTEMAHRVDANTIDIRVPASDHSDNLQQAVEAYHTWARQHAGTELAFFKTHQGTIPFYDDASVHQIRTDIRRSQREDANSDDPDANASHKLMQARVFLQLAQEYDLQNRSIRSSLDSQVEMERAMLQNLQGTADGEDPQLGASVIHGTDRPGNYMLAERIAAWGSLVHQDPEVTGVFVTDSRSVLETVLEEQPTAVEIGQWHCPTARRQEDVHEWQSRFAIYLARLVSEAWPIDMPEDIAVTDKQSEAGQTALDVYLVPEVNPYAFWAQHAMVSMHAVSDAASDGTFRNVVLALIH